MTLAIIFDSAGAGEWLVLLAVLLIVMGPQRLPSTARKIGAYYSKFRRAAESFKRQIMEMDTEMERELAKVEREAESAMNIEESAGEVSDAGPEMPLSEQGSDGSDEAPAEENPDHGHQPD